MRNLVAFLLRYQGVMLFVLLEIASLYLFVTNNSYQRAAFFNSANTYTGVVLARRKEVADYFHLTDLNRQLLAENTQLRQQLFRPDFARREADSLPVGRDTLGHVIYRHLRPLPPSLAAAQAARLQTQTAPHPDTVLLSGVRLATHGAAYPLVPARVINNSLHSVDNYLTLNVGAAEGVQHGMGVLSATGIVGRVKNVSEHYATVTSLLNSQITVSAKIKRDGTEGAVRWLGNDYEHVLLDLVPRQNRVVRGDTIVTSGYNPVYPEGALVGVVESFVKEPDKGFWTINVRLGTDFSRLTYVYVVHNRLVAERKVLEDSLTAPTPDKPAPKKAPVAPVAADAKPAPAVRYVPQIGLESKVEAARRQGREEARAEYAAKAAAEAKARATAEKLAKAKATAEAKAKAAAAKALATPGAPATATPTPPAPR